METASIQKRPEISVGNVRLLARHTARRTRRVSDPVENVSSTGCHSVVPITGWVALPRILPTRRGVGAWVGRVVHIDRYGNIVTNIAAEMLQGTDPAWVVVEIAGKKIVGLKQTYADGAEGELIALISSSWELEIAQRNGNAAKTLGISTGSEIVVWG